MVKTQSADIYGHPMSFFSLHIVIKIYNLTVSNKKSHCIFNELMIHIIPSYK
jgi:hypothetical protein